MEEKIIIEGKPSKQFTTMLLAIGLAMLIIGLFIVPFCSESFDDYGYISALCCCLLFEDAIYLTIAMYLFIFLSLYILILWFSIQKVCITLTNKRVYGNSAWNKRVDLPLNQISAVATSWLKGIAVGTSSGRIIFNAIENNLDIHKEITSLLTERQETPTSNINELRNYKELLDTGVISQEEFDAKKKQLLGL